MTIWLLREADFSLAKAVETAQRTESSKKHACKRDD